MAELILRLGDFTAVVKPAATQGGDLARLSGDWTSGIVADIVDPYGVKPIAALPDDNATTALPE